MRTVYKGYLTDGKGLSSTSANYIANLGKEYIVELEHKLNNIVCYDTTMTLMLNTTPVTTSKGLTDDDIKKFNDILVQIADIKSLCAWLREAIKAKDELAKNVDRVSVNEWVKNTFNDDITKYYGGRPNYDRVEFERTVSEQASYLKNETYAAVFGQFIHNNSPFNTARKRYHEIKNNPNEVDGNGQDRIVISYTPTVSENVIESTFMNLQHTWREYEARLNKLKYDAEQENKKREIEAENIQAENGRIYKEYTTKYNTWRLEELNRISKLKIVIPAEFEHIYLFLESLGKETN